jgi:exodeoxyribonuclease VII large subunit
MVLRTSPLPGSAALSVTELNEQIRSLLQPMREIRVQGEVSGARLSSGHLYFDLKDAGSKIRVTVWRSSLARIPLAVKDGMQVVCTGRVDVWVAGGSYALSATQIESAGLGALFAALQRLKEKLQGEGLFDAERKSPLPYLPRVVGLVTSPSGAALRDMVRILRDRFPVRVLLAPAKVQGDGAAESCAQGIELLDRSGLCDVIIVGRGGGSLEDLWAFNEERLVRAVAACRTPIVSAVGHETDTLLTDLAADVRAPTPTAAAEMVVPRLDDLEVTLEDQNRRMHQALHRLLTSERRHLGQLTTRLGDGAELTGHRSLRLEDITRRLLHATSKHIGGLQKRHTVLRHRLHAAHPLRRLDAQRRRLDALAARLVRQGEGLVERRRERLDRVTQVLQAMSPRAALQRGFGIVRRQDGSTLHATAGVKPGEVFEVLLHDGALDVTVQTVRPNER